MARIDAAAIRVDRQWVAAADVVDAAMAQVRHALEGRAVRWMPTPTSRWKSIRVSRRWPCRTCWRTPRNTPRRAVTSTCSARVERDGLHVAVTDHGPGLDPASSTTCSSGSIAAARRGRRRSAPAWGSRSRAGCWRRRADGSGPRTCPRPARDSRSWCRAPCARSRWPNSDGRAYPHRRRRAEHSRHRRAAAAVPRLRRVLGDERPRRPRKRGTRQARPDRARLGLPDMDGVDVCRQIRETLNVPILVLSARGAEGDKVGALDAGADDYVTKPFGAEELLARIRASLRRVEAPSPPSEPMVRGELIIDRERFRVVRDGEEVRLTPKEFELLTYSGAASGTGADAPDDTEGDLGSQRGGPAGASSCARRRAAEEDRAQSFVAPVHPHRTVGWLSLRGSLTCPTAFALTPISGARAMRSAPFCCVPPADAAPAPPTPPSSA